MIRIDCEVLTAIISRKAQLFYDEVQKVLFECTLALRDETKEPPSPTITSGVRPDHIRKTLRVLQDDILVQAAELVSCRDMLREEDEHANTESIDMEIVTLAAEVTELRADLQRSEAEVHHFREQLTESEAREAIVEAELHSVKALLKRAEEDLAGVRQKLVDRTGELDALREQSEKQVENVRQGVEARVKDLEETVKNVTAESDSDRQALANLRNDLVSDETSSSEVTEVQSIQEILKQLQMVWNTRMEDTRTKIQHLEEKENNLTARVEDLQRTIGQLQNKVAAEHQVLEQDIKSRSIPGPEVIVDLERQLEVARAALSALQIGNDKSNDELTQHRESTATLLASGKSQARIWLEIVRLLSTQVNALATHASAVCNKICKEDTVRALLGDAKAFETFEMDWDTYSKVQEDAGDLPTWMTDMERLVETTKHAIMPIVDKVSVEPVTEAVIARWKDVAEAELPEIRELYHRSRRAELNKITFRNFKVNDLALFLPTRNPKAWAAFNVNAPHFFLSPESGKLYADRMKYVNAQLHSPHPSLPCNSSRLHSSLSIQRPRVLPRAHHRNPGPRCQSTRPGQQPIWPRHQHPLPTMSCDCVGVTVAFATRNV
ncbi:hypothetical protein DFJ77DRAFT_239582 [Powellomyces hirtus]|nr:hypothetical protein DFJ77DRAFT_239582 [Powellomyces hirtus]